MRPRRLPALTLACILGAGAAHANNLGENLPWGFQTTQERAIRSTNAEMVMKHRGGLYDASRYTVINNTWIDRQVNCTLSNSSTGNSGTNGMSGQSSSPTLNNATSTSAGAGANSATGSSQGTAGAGVGSTQSNTGMVLAGVNGSTTSGALGPVNAAGGTTTQALNAAQTSSGMQTASVLNSSACAAVQ